MNSDKMHIGRFGDARARRSPFLRGFIEGTAGLFDVFGVRALRGGRGTSEDDARELYRDVECIAQDFHAVLSSIESTAGK
jgi:hypothetical protein